MGRNDTLLEANEIDVGSLFLSMKQGLMLKKHENLWDLL